AKPAPPQCRRRRAVVRAAAASAIPPVCARLGVVTVGAPAGDRPEETGGDHRDGPGVRVRERRGRVLRPPPRRGERRGRHRPLRRLRVPHPIRRPDPRLLLRGLRRRQARPPPRRLPPLRPRRLQEGPRVRLPRRRVQRHGEGRQRTGRRDRRVRHGRHHGLLRRRPEPRDQGVQEDISLLHPARHHQHQRRHDRHGRGRRLPGPQLLDLHRMCHLQPLLPQRRRPDPIGPSRRHGRRWHRSRHHSNRTRRVRGVQGAVSEERRPRHGVEAVGQGPRWHCHGRRSRNTVMESLEHAMRRDAPILAEYLGGAVNSNAYHMTNPRPDGCGVSVCIRQGLENAGVTPEEVNYINAHATSTPAGDLAEVNALKQVFKDPSRIKLNATKSMIGHSLGAAGGLEAIATIKAITTGWVHPTINQFNPEPEVDQFNTVRSVKQQHEVHVGISNSFGFGGQNSVVVFAPFKS
ncbi:hypothetical protein CFC21_022100, partial [Triticum aestivum]